MLIKAIVVLVVIAAIAGGIGYIYNKGGEAQRDHDEKVNLQERVTRQAEIAGLNQDISDSTKEREAARAAGDVKIAAARAERKGRLNEFVPSVADAGTCLRAGWVRYIDAAAAGVPLDAQPGTGLATAPAGITTAQAADTIASNYDICHDYKKRVADILTDFDDKRARTNSVIDKINQRLKRAEGRVQ